VQFLVPGRLLQILLDHCRLVVDLLQVPVVEHRGPEKEMQYEIDLCLYCNALAAAAEEIIKHLVVPVTDDYQAVLVEHKPQGYGCKRESV